MVISPSRSLATCSRRTQEQSQGCCAGGELLQHPKFCILVPLQPPLPCLHHPASGKSFGNPKFAAASQLGMRNSEAKRQKNLCLIFLGADSRSLSCSTGEETPALLSQGKSLHPSALFASGRGIKAENPDLFQKGTGELILRGKKLKNCLAE